MATESPTQPTKSTSRESDPEEHDFYSTDNSTSFTTKYLIHCKGDHSLIVKFKSV